jgi:hypothetical protein
MFFKRAIYQRDLWQRDATEKHARARATYRL